jgi:isoleucyl-tRNA synthetase
VLSLPVVGREDEHLLVWTTTPWTLSANTALAVHPELEYLRVRQDGKVLILSRGTTGILDRPHEVLGTVRGADLVGLSYRGPFDDLEAQRSVNRRVVAWEDVGEAEGTGIVHIAPGCGAEDYELSRLEGLDVLVPVNEFGDYVAGYGRLTGKNVRETNPVIFDDLRQKGVVNRVFDYTHRYPTCWRCGEELVFRLSQEWFIGVEEIRPRMKAAAASVWWVPASAGKRMEDWLNNMGDWNISRRRYWGLPLPFYPCQACGTLTVIGSMDELRERATSGLERLRELHRPWIDEVKIRCSGCEVEVSRITEVGDAWLDAGIVPFSTLGPGYLKDRETWAQWYPADFITEMREQIRLWFYSMLFMSVALQDRSPYQAVLAFEKLLDEHGKPMHKSLGNAIWFDEAAEKMGADVMRWLYAGQNVQANLLFGYGPAEEVKRKLLVLWNTYSFFVTYAGIDRYDPTKLAAVPVRERTLLDRWIISRLQSVIAQVREGLDRYEASGPTDAVERFVDDLSTWYVRRGRRRFWKSEDDADKRAAYDTLHEVLTTLARLLAPILPFLSEAMYQNLVRSVDASAPESVHHTRYPEADAALRDERVEAMVEQVREIVSLGRAARTEAKVKVRQPLGLIRVAVPPDAPELPDDLAAEIRDELNVKRVEITRNLGEAASVLAKARPQVLGPKLGSRFPQVQRALQQGQFTLREDGGVDVEGLVLGADEVDVSRVPSEGWSVGQGERYAVALDLRLTPELIAEGRARELVRRIQEMRKEAGFNVEDHIITEFQGADDLARVLASFGGYVRQETLSDDLRASATPGGHVWSGRIDGLEVTIGVQRTAAE